MGKGASLESIGIALHIYGERIGLCPSQDPAAIDRVADGIYPAIDILTTLTRTNAGGRSRLRRVPAEKAGRLPEDRRCKIQPLQNRVVH